MNTPRFVVALDTLHAHAVDLIVVGGVAAVALGAPISTFDLDIVHERSPDNVARLVVALRELDAFYRGRGTQRLSPEAHHLSGAGHNLLLTKAGPLDVLGTIGDGLGYEELLPHTVTRSVGSHEVKLLGLPMLIQIKEELGRDKDKAMLGVLKATLAESQKS